MSASCAHDIESHAPQAKKTLDSGINSRLYNAGVTSSATNKDFLRAGELAAAAGVSTDTLRHYERKGVLAAARRSQNGYREYPSEALARVRLVRRAISVGFTLAELARILKARDRGGAPCREVRALAAGKLSDIETRVQELISVRDELRGTLRDWAARLAGKAEGERAGLLEALSVTDAPAGAGRAALAPVWRRRRRAERKVS